MTAWIIVIACLTLAAAGFIQGLTGFGFAIVAMAVLPLAMEFQDAFSLVALSSLIIPGLTLVNARQGIHIPSALPLTIGCMAGVLLGFWFMHQNIRSELFVRLFGLVLIGFAIVDSVLARTMPAFRMPAWVGGPAGAIGGFFGGAFNIGGPPMVVFCYSQPWTKQQIVATLQIAFLCATGLRLSVMGSAGYFHGELWMLLAITVVPIALGIVAGGRLLERVEKDNLKKGVFIVVGLLGVKYLVWP